MRASWADKSLKCMGHQGVAGRLMTECLDVSLEPLLPEPGQAPRTISKLLRAWAQSPDMV